MNRIAGEIIKITSSGNISLVEAKVKDQLMAAIVIGNSSNTSYLNVGQKISLLFKETEVSIAKDFVGQISMRNQLEGTILKMKIGEVFSNITFDFHGIKIISLITSGSSQRLNLKV
jgi:molybdopterin-binding protein